MSSKFFNNTGKNTLFKKLEGIADQMDSFNRFYAVVGFFRSSGYFKLREKLDKVSEIKILVGINIDDIFRKHNKAELMFPDPEKAKKLYNDFFKHDIKEAGYENEVEQGMLQLFEDLKSGLLEMKIHATKNLHAKFYLCLPEEYTENRFGSVIMGSSNISMSGLGLTVAPRYELNVEMRDYDDVKFCLDEFDVLWREGVPFSMADIDIRNTHLGCNPSPYELYLKVLIDTFGDRVEDDFSFRLPDGVIDLKYQRDAVIQGYQMLLQHSGLFLADVVGLGKTMIAAMITKRFIEANGSKTNVLIVYPPALADNWRQTFDLFGISSKAQFITNGSLSNILDGKGQYKNKEAFDLIIVDEAHGFRNDGTAKYDDLQKICKSPCANEGRLKSKRKKVMLLSATPLNNQPADLRNQLLLFQDSQGCTIPGIPNLNLFFAPLISQYQSLMKSRGEGDVGSKVDEIYETIRNKVIDKVTVRRTRSNILNDPDYRADIEAQGIKFPEISKPQALKYLMAEDTSRRFDDALVALSSDKGLSYARYRAIEFLKPEYREKYERAEQIAQSLAGIYRVHMVKRLESSFYAFKKSLETFLRITTDMINMFEEGKVIIAPELNIKERQASGQSLDSILNIASEKGLSKEEILFSPENFEDEFLEMLKEDRKILDELNQDWAKETKDPKFEVFKAELENTFTQPEINPSGKIVLFSESVDTLNYLYDRMTELGRKDVLKITSENRKSMTETIRKNFDANSKEQEDEYKIIISSEVLAEGVNLHRANVIVNYDSPWNATRLMQRIGRVNRIGSTADKIYNYMFYPSRQGDAQIRLYKNALIKLQGFHSALGEDAQIYSEEEIVKVFRLYDNTTEDSVDKKTALLREVRELYNRNRELYCKIKSLPPKCRVMRNGGAHSGKSVVFISSDAKTEFYQVTGSKTEAIDFLEAVELLRATPDERAPQVSDLEQHYKHVADALGKYRSEYMEAADTGSINRSNLDRISVSANNFLRGIMQKNPDNEKLKEQCGILTSHIDKGTYSQLSTRLSKLAKRKDAGNPEIADEIADEIGNLIEQYPSESQGRDDARDVSDPQIIVSETFV